MSIVVKPAVFLDRDGVINKKAALHDYIKTWSEFEFLPNVAEAIMQLNKMFFVVIISNQRGVARKIMTQEDVDDIHQRMLAELKKEGAVINGIYTCPHDIIDQCVCRKPKPGMILTAAKDLSISLTDSYMVGDDITDIEAGQRAGCKTVFIGMSKVRADIMAADLLDAAHLILKDAKK